MNLIDSELWDLAGWLDTTFFLTQDLDQPAGIALNFENYPAAQKIFTTWRKTLGENDPAEKLRVSILHGTTPAGEVGYTVHFTSEPLSVIDLKQRKPQHLNIGSRFRFKDAISNENLEWFIASYQRHQQYFVLPLPMEPMPDLSIYLSHRIWKNRLHYRDFSEVNTNDIDAPAVPS